MFTEGHVEVDGARVRYAEAGQGTPLVHVGTADGPAPTPADNLLARQFRVIALPTPGGGPTLERVIERFGLADFNLMATADASAAAISLALAEPGRVRALVLFGTSDQEAAQDSGRVYTGLIPNSHLVFVYDAASAIGRDRPEAFAEVVADFLERHEAFIISRTPTVIHP